MQRIKIQPQSISSNGIENTFEQANKLLNEAEHEPEIAKNIFETPALLEISYLSTILDDKKSNLSIRYQ